MFALVKAGAALIFCPSVAGAYCWTLKYLTPHSEHVRTLMEREKTLGDCKIGLIKSFDNHTGGFIEDIAGSELERDEFHKVKRLIGNLREQAHTYGKVKNSCDASKKIVDLTGSSNKGVIGTRDGTGPYIRG